MQILQALGWLSWLNVQLLILAQVIPQGHAIEPSIGLQVGCGVCLRVSLPLPLPHPKYRF